MPGAELDLALLAGLIAIVALGPGRFSVDDKLVIEPAPPEAHAPRGCAAASV